MEDIQRSCADSTASENRLEKPIFALLFSGRRLLALHKLPKGCKMNSQYFYDVVLEETKRSVAAITGKSGIEGMMIHLDNCQILNSARTTQRLGQFQAIRFANPSYFPDTPPCDFWFFGWGKDMMKGHQFQSADDVRAFLVDLWSNLDQSTLIRGENLKR
jgi:hypothetical protein